MGFVCPSCGREHGEMPRDVAFSMPDVVWALDPETRQKHLDWSTDLAYFEGVWFIRGILEMPVNTDGSVFGWGLWAAASEETFRLYMSLFQSDGSGLPRESGRLANRVKVFPDTMNLPVSIQFRTAKERPSFFLDPDDRHPFALLQERGLSCEDVERIIRIFAPRWS